MSEQPLLVVVGRSRSIARACAPTVLFLALASGAIVTSAVLVGRGVLPTPSIGVFPIVGVAVALALAIGVGSWLRQTEGRVVFFDDRIEYGVGFVAREGPRWRDFAWSEVVAFDDGSSDVVRLRLAPREPWMPRDFNVPTLSEADRVAVLALLDRKGVRREERS